MSEVATGTTPPFSRRATMWVVGLSVVSFLCALLFAALGRDPGEVPDHQANTYSRSAIGHHGFLMLLRKLDVPVVVSRHDSGKKAGDDALLLIAEPRPQVDDSDGDSGNDLAGMIGHADTVLIVLPKRRGPPRRERKGWIRFSGLVPEAEVNEVIRATGAYSSVVRPKVPVQWHGAEGEGAAFASLVPELADPQLIVGDEDLYALVDSPQGVLIAERRVGLRRVVILSDPDLIANHGLGDGDNAPLALAIVERLRGAAATGRPIIIDETMHGRKSEPTVWRALFSFPLVLATIAGLLAVMALLAAAMGRFGAPLPPTPAIEPGKGFLIANTAALIRLGGHSTHALSRYLATTIQDVARLAHAPAELGPERLRDWLEQVRRARKVPYGLADLEAEVDAASRAERGREQRVVAAAHRIYTWRQEMVNSHGPGNDTARRR